MSMDHLGHITERDEWKVGSLYEFGEGPDDTRTWFRCVSVTRDDGAIQLEIVGGMMDGLSVIDDNWPGRFRPLDEWWK